MLLFQFEGLAEDLLRDNDWHLFREFTRHHPELENWIPDLERPQALTAAINIYRANAHPKLSFSPQPFPRVSAPTMRLWASNVLGVTPLAKSKSAYLIPAPHGTRALTR